MQGNKSGSNLAESSKESCGSKRAVLPMIVVMMIHISHPKPLKLFGLNLVMVSTMILD
jgi:hypothetical protein